jgi:hypothetical protein
MNRSRGRERHTRTEKEWEETGREKLKEN